MTNATEAHGSVLTLATGGDMRVSRLEDLCAEIVLRHEEFEKQRYVSRDVIEKLKGIGLYRASTPRCFNGDALPPTQFLQVIERISRADGSAGWVASFACAGVYLAALPRTTQAQIYANGPDRVFAGALFPLQTANLVTGGWTVGGTWKFASGCKCADLMGVGIGTGSAGHPGSGKPRTAVLSPSQVEIIENWDVMGLRGTGSHDLHISDVFVPEDSTFIRGGQSVIDEPLFHYPTIAYAAQVLAVVNLGIARAALDEIVEISGGKVPITGAPRLADRAYVRLEVGKAEAQLRAARSFFYDATDDAWRSILAGTPVSTEQTSLLRLSAVAAARAGLYAVQTAYQLAGTTAIYTSHPLQRYIRDALVVTQHAFLSEGIYDSAGAVSLGIPPMPGYI